jgi:hypothetical protein
MAEQLFAGVARVDITPPIGQTMAGYGARTKVSDGIDDPLYAYAVAFEQGDQACAIVVADLIGIPRKYSDILRERVAELGDLPAERVMVCATHTHWGPILRKSGYLPPDLKEAVSEDYSITCMRQMAGAVAEAWRTREPAIALSGAGDADLVSFNRRPVTTEGQVAMNLLLPPEQALVASRIGRELSLTWEKGGGRGQRLSDPVPEVQGLRIGPANTQVPVLKLIRPDGSPIAAVLAFGCHPVCGGDRETTFYRYSADYPAWARRVIETTLGCPAVFLLGCAGDQVPLRRGNDSRQRIGHSIGAEALRVWELLSTDLPGLEDGIGPLRVGGVRTELPLREMPTVEEAREALAATGDPDGTGGVKARHDLSLAEKYDGQTAQPIEVWSMAFGDQWGLVGLPGEVLCEFELQIRQQSPFETTAVIELAQSVLDYLPTDAAIDEGGYEPGWSPFGKGTEAAAVDGAVAALRDVAPR